jgi:hypothetical protein
VPCVQGRESQYRHYTPRSSFPIPSSDPVPHSGHTLAGSSPERSYPQCPQQLGCKRRCHRRTSSTTATATIGQSGTNQSWKPVPVSHPGHTMITQGSLRANHCTAESSPSIGCSRNSEPPQIPKHQPETGTTPQVMNRLAIHRATTARAAVSVSQRLARVGATHTTRSSFPIPSAGRTSSCTTTAPVFSRCSIFAVSGST